MLFWKRNYGKTCRKMFYFRKILREFVINFFHNIFFYSKNVRKETQKYLAKVNDNKSVKSKRDKKSEPGVGTLTKDQTVVVQKKIQEQIKKNEDQFKIQEKKSKTQNTKCFENDLIPGLGSFPRHVSYES